MLNHNYESFYVETTATYSILLRNHYCIILDNCK